MDRFATLAVHSGLPRCETTGALVEQICLSTSFEQVSANHSVGGYTYTRSENPNRASIEKAIAALEGAEHALVFSSGLAATATIILGLASNAHVVCQAGVYGGTVRYLSRLGPNHGVSVSFANNLEADVEGLIRDDTKLIWIETPSNPTLSLVDIAAVCDVAHRKGVLVVVDNTFLSPYLQNPLKHGADMALHSATKWLNGHSDVLMGAVAFDNPLIGSELGFLQKAMGSVPSPFDCWLAHRGIKTLHARVRLASETALGLAEALSRSPHVLAVAYPGLDSHPQRGVAMKQHREGMGGGIVSFRIKGGSEAAGAFCEKARLFALAESLGGVESLCEVPALMTHNSLGAERLEELGVFGDMIRLSVGLEDGRDLIEDVEHTLEQVVGSCA